MNGQGHYPKGLKRRSHHDAARSMFALFQRKPSMPLGSAVTAEIAKGYSIPKITAAPLATPPDLWVALLYVLAGQLEDGGSLGEMVIRQTKHRMSRSPPPRGILVPTDLN